MTSYPRLVVTGPPDQAGMVLELTSSQLIIGHSETADLVLADRFVSRRHALMTVDPDAEVTIIDLNSTSGTFVNDERLTGSRVLRAGDTIRFADLTAVFEPGTAPFQPALFQPASAQPASAQPASAQPEAVAPPAVLYTVTGTVRSPVQPGLAGLDVQLVDKNIGGDQVLSSTQTAADGSFSFGQLPIADRYLADHNKTAPDFQAKVLATSTSTSTSTSAGASGSVLGLSAVAYSAQSPVTLDVMLPAGTQGLPSEYDTLTASIAAAYPGSLATLQESAVSQDITYLANRIRFDARAIALAALANQFSQITAPGQPPPGSAGKPIALPPAVSLAPEFYYALFRAGLPASTDSLFLTSTATAQAVWQQAIAGNVIPAALASQIPAAVAAYQTLSASQLLAASAPAGVSTLPQLLAPVLPEAADQSQFARLYTQYQGNWAAFWPAVTQVFGSGRASQLQLLGQLYFLAGGNQPVVAALLGATANEPISTPADLAARGYYDPASWAPLISGPLPAGLPGADQAAQAASYAQLLAAQVRIAFPTAVLTDQVRRGILPVAGSPAGADDVVAFLTEHSGTFEIGAEPVQGYLARTGTTGTPDAVISEVQRLQRAYQLTPDDTSLAVLLRHNLDSAYAITRYDAAGFTRALGTELGGADVAAAIYGRARQIFGTTLGVTMAYLSGRVAPALGGSSPVSYGLPPAPPASAYPVIAYPTLENLFGSADYCDCSDCSSILSPAAYLVDLLNYVDQPAPAAGLSNPQDVLLDRRPDLQYLPLTCANTNTALPYIDIVNETLEYYVGNGLSMAGFTGYDTTDTITSAELIANPQNVNDCAYATVASIFFPPPLPFSRPLTLLRLHLNGLSIALADAMTALRSTDDLVSDITPVSYGWSDILIERLGISRDEYRIFTDSGLELGDLYGLPDATALETLQSMSLRDYSRRTGVGYDDLVTIVSTSFINPNAALIPRLQQLNAPFSTLKVLHDNLGTASSIAAEFIAALPAGLDATQYGGSGPADYQAVVDWVTGPAVYPLIMDIITITDPAGGTGDCSGASLQFRYSNPDNTANSLSGTDFLKLIRFIRLWQKIGPLLGEASDAEAIGDTAAILTALYPPADLPADTSDAGNDTASRPLLDAGFRTTLLRLGSLVQVDGALSLGAAGLGRLLACWAPIGTAGPGSLYRAMFLTPTLLAQDPGAQTATVGTVNTGDVLHTEINGVQVADHVVAAGQTTAQAAAAIAAVINATTTAEPASGQPLNERVLATAEGAVITIKAGFTLACAGPAGYSAAAGSPLAASATVAGPVTAGDVLITTIDTIAISCAATAADTPATLAVGIAAAINASTVADPYSGLPVNQVVVAASSGATITVIAAGSGAPLTLSCALTPAAAGGTGATATSASGYTAGSKTPPFADNGSGEYLADPTQTLFAHQPTLCAACNLTGAEFTLITGTLGFDPSTPLTLGTVSAVFRYGWLAHATGLSVLEFVLLREYTGLDPFAPLDPSPAPPAQPPVIGFLALVSALAAAGMTPGQALYLLWNADISGTSAPRPADITGLAFALRGCFAAVDAQFALQDDPDGSIAQGLMTLVYGSAASAFFFGLLNGTFSASVSYPAPPGQSALPPPVTAASGGLLSYNEITGQLSYSGILGATEQAAIDAAITAGDPALPAAVSNLAAACQRAVGPFFATYPELRPLYDAYAASTDPAQDRRSALLAGFLPVLQAARKQEQALASVTSAAGTDPSFATELLPDAAILHADGSPGTAASADLLAIGNIGLSAQFYLTNDLTAPPGQAAEYTAGLGYAQTATVGGTITAGDVLTTTINGIAVGYTADVGDTTLAALAGHIATAISQAAASDPVTGLPLCQLVTATAAGPVLTITGLDPSGAYSYFTLACSVSGAGTESYTAASQLPAGTGGGPVAGIWSGFVTVPQNGGYQIQVAADPGAAITVTIGGSPVPGAQSGALWRTDGPVPLVAGQLTTITLTATSLRTTLSVSWQTAGLGWQPIPGQYLYSATALTALGGTYTRFLKATSLATALSLTAAELAGLSNGAMLGANLPDSWISLLPVTGPADPGTAAELAAVLTELLSFATMKAALSPADARLLAVLQDPAAPLANQAASPPGASQNALLSLTGWSGESVSALVTAFFPGSGGTGGGSLAALGSVPNLRRVYNAFALVRACGLSAAALLPAITNNPSAGTVSALQSALRARYAEADWLTVIRPISDAARIAQRDALVAYILQRLGDQYAGSVLSLTTTAAAGTGASTLSLSDASAVSAGMLAGGTWFAPGTTVTGISGNDVSLSQATIAAVPAGATVGLAPASLPFDSPDTLYEYFLIDPQTQPPVLTSRIRLALSAVQLFAERVLRNMEPQVAPADIDASQWDWMKRYRVWQANREVFLWPENWLYPELRDNASPFFTQVMSSLLQGDITADAAATAYLSYLTSLEEVAKLEPCGMYYIPGGPDTDETTYVVARTAGAHRKYYFRQLAGGSWTPWTEVKIDCEDLPITPVVWNGRLFLFWLKIIKQAQPQQADPGALGGTQVTALNVTQMQQYAHANQTQQTQNCVSAGAVLCWSEYYNGTWQLAKTSDLSRPTTLGSFDLTGPNSIEAARQQLRIVPADFTGRSFLAERFRLRFTLPAGSLILAISAGGTSFGSGGFVLHNTHSLPVRFDDITLYGSFGGIESATIAVGLSGALDPYAPLRTFSPVPDYTGGYAAGTFTISYLLSRPVIGPGGMPLYSSPVLQFPWLPRYVEPQPGLPGAWDAPFLYEDRRYLFFVTTTERLVTLREYGGFGLASGGLLAGGQASAIPPLTLGQAVITPAGPAEIGAIAASGGDPAALTRFLSQSTSLSAALTGTGLVTYQGQQISLAGSLLSLDLNPGASGEGE